MAPASHSAHIVRFVYLISPPRQCRALGGRFPRGLALGSHLVRSISTSSPASNILRPSRLFACGGERGADALHCPRIDSKLFSNDTHTGSPGAARAYPNSLRHLRPSLPRPYHPADSHCGRTQSEHFLDFMKQRHSPLLRSGPPV